MKISRCAAMRAKPPVEPRVDDLFRSEWVNIINMRHELVRLAGVIDWSVFDREFGAQVAHRFALARRLHAQRREDSNKLYALHAPEVECIVEGKARTPYEVGVKVSVAVTAKEGVVVGMGSMPGNPYDGHTLENAIEQVEILTATTPSVVLADRGYRSMTPLNPATRLILSRTRESCRQR